jgi:crossover junction endodeoxyribonuclease RusA
MKIKILLAFPPSVNRLWRAASSGKVYKSKEYTDWLKTAVMNAKVQAGNRKIEGSYKLTLEVVRPDKRKRDLDNTIKAVSDCLVHVGIIDDSKCEYLVAKWVKGEYPCTVTVETITLGDTDEQNRPSTDQD